jgi:hypothetical protein
VKENQKNNSHVSSVMRWLGLGKLFLSHFVHILKTTLLLAMMQTLKIVFAQQQTLLRRGFRIRNHTIAKVALQT